MKIAIIAPSEIPTRRANTIQVMKMAQAFILLGHSVQMAVPKSSAIDIRDQADWDGLSRHYGLQVKFPIQWLRAKPQLRRYDFSWRAIRWAQALHVDLLYTRVLQAAAFANLLGLPTILEVHDLPQGTLGPFYLSSFLKGKTPRRLVVITRALTDDLVRKFGKLISPTFVVIAPDGVDLARYMNLPTPKEARLRLLQNTAGVNASSLNPERFTVGYTGHLYSGRGIDLLLALAQRLTDISFLIVGGEPTDVSQVRVEVDRLGLGNVILTGFIPNADLPLFQAACEVLLLPYQQRVAASSGGDIARYLSPMKLFEYMACERAIISSALPAICEILNPNNAILLPHDDIDAWCAAVQALRRSPDNRARLAAQARDDVQQYTWESRAEKIVSGFENALASIPHSLTG